jgi:hypothetical protein
MPFQLTSIVGYYTSKPIPILNPVIENSKLIRNQLLTWFEQLCNLEQRPCCNLSLGLATKVRACEGVSKVGRPVVAFHAPESVGECEKMNPHTPK